MPTSRRKRLKERLDANGPGLTVAVIAVILALSGAAFAASGALTGKQKREVEKIAKKFAGKPGTPGTPGAQGAQGTPGAQGAQGAQGPEGPEGPQGAAGQGVIASNEPTKTVNCGGLGGSKFVTGVTTTFACNGKEGPEGPDGPEGSPWTAGGTLPPGATETGNWAFNGTDADVEGIRVPISFPIPLSDILFSENVHFGVAGSGGAFSESGACPTPEEGEQNPKALPGELCVYQQTFGGLVNATFEGIFRTGIEGANRAGAYLKFAPTDEVAYGNGTFAVTGCTFGEPPFECPPEP